MKKPLSVSPLWGECMAAASPGGRQLLPTGETGEGLPPPFRPELLPTGETGEGLYLYTILSMRKLVGTATISTSTGATSRCMPTATKMLKSTMCSE